jgi:peptidyl-dipeptidase A
MQQTPGRDQTALRGKETRMTTHFARIAAAGLALAFGCGTGKEAPPDEAAAEKPPVAEKKDPNMEARQFLDAYNAEFADLEKTQTLAYWKAANSGAKEDWDAFAAADLALKKFHSDKGRFAKIEELRKLAGLAPLVSRSLTAAWLAFKGNQLSGEMLEKLVKTSTEIEQTFNTFRAELDGKKLSNNELLELLEKEKKTPRRQAIWGALKQVGGAVGPKLVELARLRNEAARELGYPNYWEMQVRLQEHDPARLLAIFAELEEQTREPFAKMKAELDADVAKRLRVKPAELMPWHYDNPFFQEAPPSSAVNLDEFYEKKAKEEIAEIAVRFYGDIGLDIRDIVERSDLYEREGKDQHAFCISIDRSGDVRTLLNIKPREQWMGTMLHEQGHAIYDKLTDRALPFNLREMAHIFTTEAVAMLFGALSKNPAWLVAYAGADPERVSGVEAAIYEQRRREQLLFARWTMVMLFFEKDLYENPDQDLNRLWWDHVERLQMLKRPPERNAPDWASKPHFTIAPVYYHNYQLGELYAAQLRHKLAQLSGHEGPTRSLSWTGRADFGEFLTREVFRPGRSVPWPEFVAQTTGEPLNARFFAEELK